MFKTIKLIKNEIQLIKEASQGKFNEFEAIMAFNEKFGDGQNVEVISEDKDIKIYFLHCDEMFKLSVNRVAACIPLLTGDVCIAVSDEFYECFNEDERKFIIGHEIGHIGQDTSKGRTASNEIAADINGIKDTSPMTAIYTINKLREMLPYYSCHREFNKRFRAVLRMAN